MCHARFPLAAVLVLSLFAAPTVADRPNILVVIGDDIGWKDYGCYGHPSIRTPNIDALAAAGLKFTHAFLTTSSCSPSRISILSGRYPHQTGAEDLHMRLPAGGVFISTPLREAGYFTGHMLKTHYGPNGMKQFDWYGKSVKEFGTFLDKAAAKPFFMWVGFRDAHRPYKAGALKPPHDPAKAVVPPFLVDTLSTRRDLALYYDEIGRMDRDIGRLLDELKKRGRFRNTLVVFLGDNGEPFPRAKGTVYDSGIGTPLVMCWPGRIAGGGVHNGLASVIDLAPTFAEVAGIQKPSKMVGHSLLPVLKDPSLPGREFIFAERNWHNADEHIRCVRTRTHKLITNAYLDRPFGHPADCSRSPSWKDLLAAKAGGRITGDQLQIFRVPRPAVELYDAANDPGEFHNLADQPASSGIRKRLEQALETWRQQTKDFPASRRRRADNVDRVTGVKFTRTIGPLVKEGKPKPLR